MRTPVIPFKKVFYSDGNEHRLDLEAICFYTALGFFLDGDSYWKDQKVMRPATGYEVDPRGGVVPGLPYFQWHHSPRTVSFQQVVEEFSELFETITREQVANHQVILPLSGGLDSRTQAVALQAIGCRDVNTYSYAFEDSFHETLYGQKIAAACGFPFHPYTIPRGYLWPVIERLSHINSCYSEFTHPRQMAVIDDIAKLGDLFFLGHWGDVLFDDMGVADTASFEEQLRVIKGKVLKRGGLELATALWQTWGLPGVFEVRLEERLRALLEAIPIENANARIRAFKSMYWAPRWTSENLNVFSSRHPMALPYYDQRMCEFICTVPEAYLAGRRIQIEYIKQRSPEIARIEWQEYHPCNLYNYSQFNTLKFIPQRGWNKFKRLFDSKILQKRLIQRNWEIQFLGSGNEPLLQGWLFENEKFKQLVPPQLVHDFYGKFQHVDEVQYSHPLSMLLTLSLFSNNNL